MASQAGTQKPQIQPCRYKTGEPQTSGETTQLTYLYQEKPSELALIRWLKNVYTSTPVDTMLLKVRLILCTLRLRIDLYVFYSHQ